MANNQTSQRPQGLYSQYQNSPRLPYQQGPSASTQSGNNASIRRTASFDPGDDAAYPQVEANILPRGHASAVQSNESRTNPQSPPYPPRSTSYGTSTASTQQHYGQVPALPPRSTYNPQQYGAPQPQHSPHLSGSLTGTFNPSYQTYNPAAYHQSGQYTQAGHGVHPPSSYQYTSQPPPPPPRSFDQGYNSRVSPPSTSNPQFSNTTQPLAYRQQPLPPLPSTNQTSAAPSYTPPAPPAPPFSPARDAYPSHSPATSISHQYANYPTGIDEGRPFSDRPQSTQSQRPPTHQHSPNASQRIASPVIHRRPVGRDTSSTQSPGTPGTPGPTPPAHSPQRTDTIGRHPQARPLPGPPSADADYFGSSNGYGDEHEGEGGYDELMQEVEAAVMGRPLASTRQRSDREAMNHAPTPTSEIRSPLSATQEENHHISTNGNLGHIGEGQYVNYDAYSDNSDAEAEAGLAAMRTADEQDAAEEARRQSGTSSYHRSQNSQPSTPYSHDSPGSSDSDVGVDISTYSSGFSGGYHYGGEIPSHEYANNLDDRERPFAATRSSQRSDLSVGALDVRDGLYDYPMPGSEYMHPFTPARVDTGGTGGLSEPGAHTRRLSFEDGDELALVDTESSYPSGAPSPSREGMPDMFFHPTQGSRPLPAAPVDHSVPQLMPAGTYKDPEKLLQFDEYGRPRFPLDPDAYNQMLTPLGTPVPRSSSLISHGSQPQAIQPIRSKTDADRAKILKQQQQSGYRSASIYGTDAFGDSAVNPSAELLGLPTIPAGKRRKFSPAKFSSNDFKKCPEPWALSSIVAWLREMSEGEADLKEHAVVDGIVALFTHKVPTMNTADAEALGAKVLRAMLDTGTLLKDEEWVKFGTQELSGVLFQLTGAGCYSSRVHTEALPGRCYSHHCMRTLKKINLQTQVLEPQRKVEDWPTFYQLRKEDYENVAKVDVERQNNLHEIVITEDLYMDQLNVLRVLYRDELAKWQPPIIAPKRRDQFLIDVFGKADAVKQVNEDYLLAQLKYRQQEQGPWIKGFSDIFREWIRKARSAYIDYAASFPKANSLIREESERNILFRQFLDQMRDNERSKRLGWDTYLKAPITRLQRYGLLLDVVHKHMAQENEEKTNLAIAIEEVKAVTSECDTKVAEMSKVVDIAELNNKLKLRPGMEHVQLNLLHMGREIIYRGDLQRMGSARFSWVDCHAILFDHYFVLAKVVESRHPSGGDKGEKYDVSKLPIPMDLLVLESLNDDPVVKSTMKGLGSVTTVTTRAGVPLESRTSRQSMSNGSGGPGTLNHTDTASSSASIKTAASGKTMVPSTTLDSPKDEKIMYPFRIKHLGRPEVYTLYAPTKQNRMEWCTKILEAKTRHAASLYSQNAEPFRLRVVADTAFAYDAMTGSSKGIVIRGTPLDRAIREVEKSFEGTGTRPSPVCRAAVNCATTFTQADGTAMDAIGTDYGVYISEHSNPRGWTRASLSLSFPSYHD